MIERLKAPTFTRPANTTQYAAGDLVANHATAGSVVALAFPSNTPRLIRRAHILKSGTTVTDASFRLHLYSSAPVPANGDNAAWSTPAAGWLGAIDVTVDAVFSDGARGIGAPNTGTEISVPGIGAVYGLLEALDTYTPASAETFTVELEAIR